MMSEIERNIGFKNAPAEVRNIVLSLKDGLQTTLNDKLIGLYLHGSLAYDCFNPEISDIDFVVVLSDLLTPEEEQILSQLHKHLGIEPNYGKRLEGTYMTEEQVKSDDYAPDFLYYVDGETFVRAKEGQGEPDFPMHRQHLYESGLKLVGCEPQKLFCPVPWEILKQSLQQEIPFIKEQFNKRPIYAMLNLCRVVRAFDTHTLSSKKEGGEWGLRYLPSKFHGIILTALKGYKHKITDSEKQSLSDNLPRFYNYCMERLADG
jgi:streptomycin 3"-adenylyltransferase